MAKDTIDENSIANNTVAEDNLPATQPMLSLLEKLGNLALASRVPSGKHFLTSVRFLPGGLELRIRISGLTQLLDGEYPLQLTILDTTPERTRFSWSLPRARGMDRLLGLGMKALPAGWLNEALGRLSGGALSAEGETVILDHRTLPRRLHGYGGDGYGGDGYGGDGSGSDRS